MKNIIYRVIIKISYYEARFEFAEIDQAAAFCKTILENMVDSEDEKKAAKVNLQIVDVEAEKKEIEERIAREKARAEKESEAQNG